MYYYYLYIVVFVIVIIYSTLYYLTKKHKNFKKRKLDNQYYVKTFINLLLSVVFFSIIFSYHTFSNHLLPKLQNIIFYFIITDSIYYWIHRIIHKTPLLKGIFHLTHHEAVKLVPFDIFYTSYKEHMLYILVIYTIPLLLMDLNRIEYLLVSIISFYHAFYTHSDRKYKFIFPLFINSKYHKRHHCIGGGNYSVFFNIWDEYTGSKINKKVR